jgi:hypothetical protein
MEGRKIVSQEQIVLNPAGSTHCAGDIKRDNPDDKPRLSRL